MPKSLSEKSFPTPYIFGTLNPLRLIYRYAFFFFKLFFFLKNKGVYIKGWKANNTI